MLEAGLRFLETRPRSIGEVRRRLTGAGYRTELVEGAIARLTDLGILDDEAFARAWVESRDRARPRGTIALRRELRLKDVEAATIEAVLAERDSDAGARGGLAVAGADTGAAAVPGADEAAAERLLSRHARALARIADPRARRRRAYALLARNGFDPETAATAAARVMLRPTGPDPAPG